MGALVKVFVCGLIFISLSFCNSRATTQELLAANFIANGQAAIDLLSPSEGQQVATAKPKFSWSSRGVSLYILDLATDSAFSKIVLTKEVSGTSYAVQNSDLSGLTSLTTSTYYWRVKVAKVTQNLQSATGSFFLFAIPASGAGYAGAIYVNKGSPASVTPTGGQTAPYRSIQGGIEAADALRGGNADIAVDVYVSKHTSAYVEQVSLKPGISVYGGYDATSNWQRDINTNVTTIQAPESIAVFAGSSITNAYTTTTVIEGFTITAAASGFSLYGVQIFTGSPSIQKNIINISNNSGANYGVYVSNSLGSKVSGNSFTITHTGTFQAYGIFASASTLTATGNTINVTVTNSSAIPYGFYSPGSSILTLSNNTIATNGPPPGGQPNYGILIASSNSVSVLNNKITVSGGTGTSYGFYANGNFQIANNLISVTGGANVSGVSFVSNCISFANNIVSVSTTGAASTAYAFDSNSAGFNCTISNSILSAGSSASSGVNAAVNLQGSNQTVTNSILSTTGGGTSRYPIYETAAASKDPTTFTNNLLFDGTALYFDEGTTPLSTIGTMCATLLGNGTTTCSGLVTSSASTANVFVTTPTPGTASSYAIKGYVAAGNGEADKDSSGGWSTGDIGPDVTKVGPQ